MVSNGVLPNFFWISQDTNVGFCCLLCHHLLLSSAKNGAKICIRSRVTCKLAIIGPRPVPILWRIMSRHQYKTILKKCCMKTWRWRFLSCGSTSTLHLYYTMLHQIMTTMHRCEQTIYLQLYNKKKKKSNVFTSI